MDQTRQEHAPNVTYFTVDGFAKEMFKCERWSASLAVEACMRRWKDAQTARGDRAAELERCRICPVGSVHAGQAFVQRSFYFDSNICPRCRQGTTRRMIGNRLCISCYNREREYRIGRNAKGKKPIKLGVINQLRPRVLRMAVTFAGGQRKTLIQFSAEVIDTEEAVLHTLRRTAGEVRFGFGAQPRGIRQLRLF